MNVLEEELILPNGYILSNRIAKSAMSENLYNKYHEPTALLINAYKKWAQLNHPERQAMEQINGELKAPSPVPLKSGGRKDATKKVPEALTESEIIEIIEAFAHTSIILKEAGFSGIQIHGAHGYLVSQFLSPYTNIRNDKWGESLENRSRFVVEIYRKIRERVGNDFPIGIKLNSADFQKGGFSEEESMEVVKILSKEGIDLIEISGGTYRALAMMGKRSTNQREAYFMEYIEKARKVTKTPLMLTGVFRTASVMKDAIASNQLDIVGIARPFAIYPNIANELFKESRQDFATTIKKTGLKGIDAIMNIIWYESQIRLIGKGKAPNPNLSSWSVLFMYSWLILEQKISKKKRNLYTRFL
jgi:2,4-dienoyl-CoA reductase-like NADH-dependent reductase (Old Yellow Enzyme family)